MLPGPLSTHLYPSTADRGTTHPIEETPLSGLRPKDTRPPAKPLPTPSKPSHPAPPPTKKR